MDVSNQAKEQVKRIEQDLTATIKTIGTVKTSMDEALRKIDADSKVSKEAEKNISVLEKELVKTTTMAREAKTTVDDITRKVDTMRKIV